MEYDHGEIEKKWQKKWQEDGLYTVPDRVEGKENFYTLVEFPYPSGNLHIGHWYAFAVPDIFARFKRMQGFNVLYPIGFDSFGLPAENAAIKRGLDPKEWTYSNIDYMSGQLRSMGNMFDWSRKIVTSDAEYYKWTQWLFIELFKKGLAYKKKGLVNWCPSCQTVLANEQVVDGMCERCGSVVTKKDLEQWYFKTTAYAERLLSGLQEVTWPEPIKESQRNWIGKSEGAEFTFRLNIGADVTVFTTRADTLFGVTYIVLAPEHPLIQVLVTSHKSEVENVEEVITYIEEAKRKSEIERTDAKKEKTGVLLEGITATHPATGEVIPVWIADYVLAQYGTGAVMAVPAHDERDFAFAGEYGLPVKQVIAPETGLKRENEQKTQGGCGVIFDPETQKYAVAVHTNGLLGFFSGGVAEDEEMQAGVMREVLEESGLYDFKHVEYVSSAYTHYYNHLKGINRAGWAHCFLMILNSRNTKELQLEEHETFSLGWASAEEIRQNWQERNGEHSFDHWFGFLNNSVSRAIKLGYDTVSDENMFEQEIYVDEGKTMYSKEFNNLSSQEAREKITEKYGVRKTTYKLRDWLLSRQRYWGCPIPIVYDPEGKPHPVPEEHLPWVLPTDDIDLTPKGTSPLGSSKELLERTETIFGTGWKPEVDTMDTFVDSSWYFLRYIDPHNTKQFADKELLQQWMPVTRYSGGAEHTTMHLLYARFFHKALYDLGLVYEEEPFAHRMNRGLILGPDGSKMSKSKGNVIDPDNVVQNVGSDTVKMYLAFIGPYNEVGSYPWDLGGIAGMRRFLERVWRMQYIANQDTSDTVALETLVHQTIKKMTDDIEAYKFNTAISQMMILVNEIEKQKSVSSPTYKTILRLLAPFAPHVTEELWHIIGERESIHRVSWPLFDAAKTISDTVTYAIQINGKVRADIALPRDMTEKDVIAHARAHEAIQGRLAGQEIVRTVFVPTRLVNFVLQA